MNINNKYIIAILAAATVMQFSCSDELINEQGTIKYKGDEIVFGGQARFETNVPGTETKTRTIYTGEFYEEDGKTYEGVQWQKDDKVRIYCPQSSYPANHISDYVVNSTNDGTTSENGEFAGLTRIDSAAALQWGNTTSQHDFYAVYPSPEQYSTGIDVFTSNTPTKITGVIPGVQVHEGIVSSSKISNNDFTGTDSEITAEGTLHVVKPNMDYAYMVARTSVANPNNIGEGVFLKFTPIATAVEVTLRNLAYDQVTGEREGINLNSVVISTSATAPIFGGFTSDLATMPLGEVNSNGVSYGSSYPTNFEINKSVTNGTSISLPMLKNGISGEPLDLKYGDAVKFTVFILPTQSLESLNITINGVQGSHTGTIKGVEVEMHKKTLLKNVPITGDVLPFNYSNWLRWISDQAMVRELSIPGTGGSATYNLQQSDITSSQLSVSPEFIKQQTVDIKTQWEAGVRCFEFSVDIENGTGTGGNLGNAPIICSGVQMSNMNLAKAVNEVQDLLLDNPNEFAMCIITYETSGGWSGTRNPATFQSQLNNFWADVKAGNTVNGESFDWTSSKANNFGIDAGCALYSPSDATVGESRGKLFCISRPTSINLDYGEVMIDVTEEGVDKNDGTGQYTYTSSKYSKTPLSQELLDAHGIITKERPNLSAHSDILIIHGWGAVKDKWQQRGFTKYSVRRTKCNDTSIWEAIHSGHYGDYNTGTDDHVKKWLWTYTTFTSSMTAPNNSSIYGNKDGKMGRPFDTSQMKHSSNAQGSDWNASGWSGNFPTPSHYNYSHADLEPDFTYETSSGTKAWVQEWARVSNAGTDNNDAFKLDQSSTMSYAIYWGNSKAEKIQRMKDAFDYAVKKQVIANGIPTEASDYVFINSLCGYYITDEYPESIYPCTFTDAAVNHFWSEIFSLSSSSVTSGMGGDIENFAKDMNEEAYNYLLGLTQGETYSPGSLGIVLMDRVGSNKGTEIPGIIIGNNFLFELDSELLHSIPVIKDEYSETDSFVKGRAGNSTDSEDYEMKWE